MSNTSSARPDWPVVEQAIRQALERDQAHHALIASFLQNARRVHEGTTGLIPEDAIAPVDPLPDYEHLPPTAPDDARDILSRVVMIKLNGGLGTSMGLARAKSLLPVKNGLSFLDIIARQVLHLRQTHGVPLPLLLMTSYSTDRDTRDALAGYPTLGHDASGLPLTFLQHRAPKLMADTLLPAEASANPDQAWCPPGHGDLYTALITRGILDELVARGFRYAFVSNADNLGAVIDPAIPRFMQSHRAPFLMEVADRTAADRKGGHLARERQGHRLLLRESAQCPESDQAAFQDIERHRYFNTNNLWVDLAALRESIQRTGGPPELALIINRKTLDPRDDRSPAVLQLETAMGAAIASFDGAVALRVPRTRFAPVKTTDDLLGLWSDAFVLGNDLQIRLAPERADLGPPVIKLDPRYYKKIDAFSARFPRGAPSLVGCRSLVVEGDHTFSPEQRFEGDVAITP
ncbi:MAG TPA: UTP--glucose-1-phosphate uridylyltransferase [Kiritimatiellia bacterium]|nr:UTP--glucose-1-phosphate uridylyltransferase [Kiritimatiellia bacterium]HMO98062.1 UTP--glucose-1-phosphate uridylyltransferase [Kiritimatiellia bacterium]HMP97008.1 UTP--glucose-1-phosphate uridylyltransferase [Kiritimatiellia bacterium]